MHIHQLLHLFFVSDKCEGHLQHLELTIVLNNSKTISSEHLYAEWAFFGEYTNKCSVCFSCQDIKYCV